jgi:undecaprenyl-diphosphatase
MYDPTMDLYRISIWLRSRSWLELRPMVVLFIAAAALLAFGKLVDVVAEGDARAFDEAVLRALRSPADLRDPIGPWWVQVMFRDLTSLGSTTVLTMITLGAIGYLLMDGKRSAALLVLVSVGGGSLISTLLKNVVARPRPELVAHLVDVQTLSFPSGHAMVSAVTFLTLGVLLARMQSRRWVKTYILTAAIVLTLLVGVSRVYLGVHWPTDVLAGWCAGGAWAMLCWFAAGSLQHRGQIENPEESTRARCGHTRSPEHRPPAD